MCADESKPFNITLSHAYFEVARATSGPIPFSVPDNLDETGINALAGWASIPIIYSYLSVEALVNFHLYNIWKKRYNGTGISKRFLDELGDQENFERYGAHKEFRELHRRVRLLCRVQGFRDPHESIPKAWQDFNELVKKARRYLVHPFPDSVLFQEVMAAILHKQPLERYLAAAQAIIEFLYNEAGTGGPKWLDKDPLMRVTGVDLFPEEV